ncbi:hypothetical protein MHW98_00855 [Winkia sp. ACRQY]|nr:MULTISPECIES: hypothetical protein [Winkia]MDK7905256.1 hypothetical protein [Winkia sp. UMB0889B]MCG7301883.1 hypothetical protein [Winkia sp. ACRQY]MDK6240957.1 hypothetical protein [Winkia sp. UMB10116]MDK7184624.1 hypothetical protein [Winkia sp. UMB1295B]MDK8224413.1 hypothetical protein [Winkia sp. UMB750B]
MGEGIIYGIRYLPVENVCLLVVDVSGQKVISLRIFYDIWDAVSTDGVGAVHHVLLLLFLPV